MTISSNTRAHLAAWLLLPFAASANGILRDFTYGTMTSELVSHSLSVIPLVLLIALLAAFLARHRPLRSRRSAVIVGAAWIVLTVGFETALGLARDVPLSRIAAEYDLSRGSLWPLVPLTTLLAPLLAQRWIGSSRRIAAAHEPQSVSG